MGAAGDEGGTHLAECIQCRTCVDACPQELIQFPVARQPIPGGEYSRIDLTRRGFLYSAAGGVGLGFLVRADAVRRRSRGRLQLIRPPGALPEGEFLRTCIRCGECMKSCVTNTLQPCLLRAGLEGLWTPRMELRFAACEQNCNVCGKVCPTQAIRSLPLDEKNHAKVGTAVLQEGELPGVGPGQALSDLRRDLSVQCHRLPHHRRLPPAGRASVPLQWLRVLRGALPGPGRVGHRRGAQRRDPAGGGVVRHRGQAVAPRFQPRTRATTGSSWSSPVLPRGSPPSRPRVFRRLRTPPLPSAGRPPVFDNQDLALRFGAMRACRRRVTGCVATI